MRKSNQAPQKFILLSRLITNDLATVQIIDELGQLCTDVIIQVETKVHFFTTKFRAE